ncbi:MAG: AraC family transcriptional regulator, partial [Ruminococcaceae bacterium]|nr:AraC family transcriptional regulator [Oscillospiraceae bacterium]
MSNYPNCPLPREINVTALVSAFHVTREHDYYFSGESHNFYEIAYVVQGKAGVTAGDRIYILEQGQCVLHPPMEFHKIWSEDSTTPELIIF